MSVTIDRDQAELKALQLRLKVAREAAGYTQAGMAKALGVKLDAYKKYENREGSSMPILIFAKFCDLVDQEPYKLLAGKHFSRHSNLRRSVR